MRISALDHIVLNVQDVERSLEFYNGCLGLAAERVDGWRSGELPFPSVRINEATLIDEHALPMVETLKLPPKRKSE